jgi:transcriptional regulator with XRE-family HTH domain
MRCRKRILAAWIVCFIRQREDMESSTLLNELDQRRRDLGLSYELLSKRCGVSRPTVQRILSGRHAAASLANILAIAESLGLGLRFDSKVEPRKLKRDQAERKAKKLVALVQGTSGLEGQAVDSKAMESMVKQTTHELLAGSKRKLWSEE